MANLWLTGSGEPTLGTGTMGDYYRDTATNLVYYRENPTTWVGVPAFTPSPDGVGTTWIHGTGAPLNTLGSDTNYYYDDADKIVYYKDAGTWVAKGSLDFIGVYGVQWGNGSGAPANTPQLNDLPASSFYLDVLTSDIYFKNLSLQWELKGQLGVGGGSSVTVINNLTSTSTTNALSAAQGKVLKDTIAASLDATVNPQEDASYTLQTPDNDGKTYLRMTNGGANTVTIPSTQTKPISIRQAGAGTTTLQAGSGVTLNGTLVFTAQHQTKTVIPLGSGIYDVVG